MSTATTRLRRAGAGGLAAAVIAGTLVATAGSALAWNTGTAQGSVSVASTPVIIPGTTGVGGIVTVTLPTTWNVGDTINFSIAGANCTVTANTVKFNAQPAIAAAKGSGAPGTDVVPTFTVAATQNGAGCSAAGADTGYTVTFTNDATNAVAPTLTIGGPAAPPVTSPAYNVGSGAATGNLGLTFTATGSGVLPAFNGTTVTDAVISPSTVLMTSGSPVVVAPNTAGQALPTVTVKEVIPGTITGGTVIFAFSNATVDATNFGTTGTAKATWSGGGTLAVAATANPNEVQVSGLTTTTTTAGTLTLSGVTVKPSAVAPAGLIVAASATNAGIVGTASVNVAADVATPRVGGSDRYYTAAALYNAAFPPASAGPPAVAGPTAVILASGANFPDALSASALAGATGAGILLTAPTSLPAPTQFAITARLSTLRTVYIIGGTGAVSASVAAQVAALGTTANPISVVRLGGTDRYATDQLVNDFAASLGGGLKKTAVVATGTGFADALAVGPEVVTQNYGMVLTDPNSLSPAAAATLVNNGFTSVIIVGGTGAVSANVESQIKALGITVAYRLAGTDRTQTAAAIANWATLGVPAVGTTYGPLNALNFNKFTVHVARGDVFADALAAGPVAAKFAAGGTVILLTVNPTTLGTGASAYVKGLATTTLTTGVPAGAVKVGTVNGLGLGGAVTNAQLNSVALGILG